MLALQISNHAVNLGCVLDTLIRHSAKVKLFGLGLEPTILLRNEVGASVSIHCHLSLIQAVGMSALGDKSTLICGTIELR